MTKVVPPPGIDAVVARARSLWREARSRHRGRLDIYVKSAQRLRVVRGVTSARTGVSRASECGVAVRLVPRDDAPASFAASAGVTEGALHWALATAGSTTPGCDPAMPPPGSIEEDERRDLDPLEPFPDVAALEGWLEAREVAGWIECGVTIEALAGDEGWVTVRRRNRIWALIDNGRPRLVARRGFLLEELSSPTPGRARNGSTPPHSEVWRLRPDAAASLIAAAARGVHRDPSLVGRPIAPAWRLVDDPTDPAALFGGAFDDVGFPSRRRVLSSGGAFVDVLDGPGTLRRTSYRDAPSATHSHLVFQGEAEESATAAPAREIARCRVLPLDGGAWLLQMDAGEGDPVFVTIPPAQLPRSCLGTWGQAAVSAEGVRAPGLVLDFGRR